MCESLIAFYLFKFSFLLYHINSMGVGAVSPLLRFCGWRGLLQKNILCLCPGNPRGSCSPPPLWGYLGNHHGADDSDADDSGADNNQLIVMVLMRASMLITFQSISSLSGESGDEKEEWSKHGQLVTDQSGKEIITMTFITMPPLSSSASVMDWVYWNLRG